VASGVVCRPCEIAEYLTEEASLLKKDFSAGIRMWHDKCKRKDCDCQVEPRGRKLLQRVRSLARDKNRCDMH